LQSADIRELLGAHERRLKAQHLAASQRCCHRSTE
jgi:hypothetical protein